jgi:hypothetical protein
MKRSKLLLVCLASGGYLFIAGCIVDIINLVAPFII